MVEFLHAAHPPVGGAMLGNKLLQARGLLRQPPARTQSKVTMSLTTKAPGSAPTSSTCMHPAGAMVDYPTMRSKNI